MHMEILFLFIVNSTSLTPDCECQYQTRIWKMQLLMIFL